MCFMMDMDDFCFNGKNAWKLKNMDDIWHSNCKHYYYTKF